MDGGMEGWMERQIRSRVRIACGATSFVLLEVLVGRASCHRSAMPGAGSRPRGVCANSLAGVASCGPGNDKCQRSSALRCSPGKTLSKGLLGLKRLQDEKQHRESSFRLDQQPLPPASRPRSPTLLPEPRTEPRPFRRDRGALPSSDARGLAIQTPLPLQPSA